MSERGERGRKVNVTLTEEVLSFITEKGKKGESYDDVLWRLLRIGRTVEA